MIAFVNDAVLGHARAGALGRVAVLILIAAVSWNSTVELLQRRQTNIDSIATALEETANPKDLIVVQPWFFGVSFSRYYHGQTPWTSIPELPELTVHRYDLAKQAMATPDAVDRVMQRITSTLMSGQRVWIVGGLPQLPPGYLYGTTPTAPHPQHGWQQFPYLLACRLEVAGILNRLAAQTVRVELPQSAPINLEEDVELSLSSGLKK